jgi:hypothetical protein
MMMSRCTSCDTMMDVITAGPRREEAEVAGGINRLDRIGSNPEQVGAAGVVTVSSSS